jgi:hypothetical protein
MNIGKAFNFIFEDDKWLSKSVIGAIVAAVPIVNFAWGGYLIELLNNVMNDEQEPLPAWSDFGDSLHPDGFTRRHGCPHGGGRSGR